MVRDVLLVMTEYGVEDAPLWYQLSRENLGNASGAELGLTSALRDDLAAWNDLWESTEQWVSTAERTAHAADAFLLASRVQVELGDDTHVWCAAGEGAGGYTMWGRAVVLAASDRGTEIEWWKDGQSQIRTVAEVGGGGGAAKAIVGWRSMTERVDTPFGDAATRAQGLRAAGLLQQDLGSTAYVIFFAGARSPHDYDRAGIRAI